MVQRELVERGFQPVGEGLVVFGRRPRHTGGGHLSGAQLRQHPFRDFPVFADLAQVEVAEGEFTGIDLVVVAGDAVLAQGELVGVKFIRRSHLGLDPRKERGGPRQGKETGQGDGGQGQSKAGS